MKLKILTSLILFLLLATTATAMTLDGSCDIRFSVQSTLHDFVGEVACQPFSLDSEKTNGSSEAASGKAGMIRQPVVKVLVAEMDTDNSGRNKKMYAMFEQEKYPEIQGLFADLDHEVIIKQLQALGDTPGQLEFDLRIREISQRVKAEIRDLVVVPERISFLMTFPLLLSDFQLEAPSVLGFIRVDNHVQIEIDVLLKRH